MLGVSAYMGARTGSYFRGFSAVFAAGFIVSFAVATLAQEREDSATMLERQVLKYRKESFQRGHVVLHCINRSKSNQETEFEFDITFDGEKLRFDRKSRLLGSSTWAGPERFAVTKTGYIEDIGPELVITTGRRTTEDARPYVNTVFDPRSLGMTVAGTAGMIHGGVGDLVGRADRDDPTVTSDRVGGLETRRLDYRFKSGSDVSIWIVPNQGFSVVRAEVRREGPGGSFMQSVVSDMKQYQEGGIWYPSRSKQELSVNGEWQERQVITVTEAEFGIPVDQRIFTLAGFDLTPGQVVQDSSTGSPVGMIWNGNKVKRMTTGDVRAARTNAVADSRWPRKWILIVNSVLCAALACYFVLRIWYRRTA